MPSLGYAYYVIRNNGRLTSFTTWRIIPFSRTVARRKFEKFTGHVTGNEKSSALCIGWNSVQPWLYTFAYRLHSTPEIFKLKSFDPLVLNSRESSSSMALVFHSQFKFSSDFLATSNSRFHTFLLELTNKIFLRGGRAKNCGW